MKCPHFKHGLSAFYYFLGSTVSGYFKLNFYPLNSKPLK